MVYAPDRGKVTRKGRENIWTIILFWNSSGRVVGDSSSKYDSKQARSYEPLSLNVRLTGLDQHSERIAC